MLLARIHIAKISAILKSQERLIFEEIASIAESLGLEWQMQSAFSDSATATDVGPLFDMTVALSDAATAYELFDAVTSYIVDTLADTATVSETHAHSFTLGDPSDTVSATDSAPVFSETMPVSESVTAGETYSDVITYDSQFSDSSTASEDAAFVLKYNQLINGNTINQRTIG